MSLKTDYKNAIPESSLRKYQQIDNGDGTISLRDVTTYTQVGDSFGASDINATNARANATPEQVTEMPSASATELDRIVQFTGTTGTYTNGHFYKCVSNGATPPVYSWSEIVYGDSNSVSYSAQSKPASDVAQARVNLNIAPKNYEYGGREIPFTWAELHAKIANADFSGLRIGDYKDITVSGTFKDYAGNANKTLSGAVFRMEIAGIDPYYQYGDAAVGHHIDFISRDCLAGALMYNSTATNSGSFIGSMLFSTLNNATDGLITLIPNDVKQYIIEKRGLTEVKTAATASSWAWNNLGKLWLPMEREVWGQDVWSEHSYGGGLAVQYDVFRGSLRHIIKGDGHQGGRCAWWCGSSGAGSAALFCYVDHAGLPYDYSAAAAFIRVPLCFRLG